MKKILIVEDETAILNVLNEVFLDKNYQVYLAKNGVEGLKIFECHAIDIIITDVMMPKMDGYEFAAKIRKKNKFIPIVMLTALSDEQNQVKAFDLEIDDFITKPFSITVLEKKIAAILRRTGVMEIFEFNNIIINFDNYEIKKEGKIIDVTNKEFAILEFLIENKNKVVTREQISDAVWNCNYYGDLRNIDTHIKNLRKKLDIDVIKTVKGVGYCFEK